MNRYIFLDNWALSSLRDPETARRITRFIKQNDLTVILTTVSILELYNPGWQGAIQKDRGAAAAHFLARVPCVIVSPPQVWRREIAAHLCPIDPLPIELDFSDLSLGQTEETLLCLLRRDQRFLQNGHDIQVWYLEYAELKKNWLADVEQIIESACDNGNLARDRSGRLIELESTKEIFLLSLDLRHAAERDDALIDQIIRRTPQRQGMGLTSVRLSSLCFWYSYVGYDKTKQPKRLGSDIGDFYNISLLPYCTFFTTDGTMYETLHRIREPVTPVSCQVMTKRILEDQLRRYS